MKDLIPQPTQQVAIRQISFFRTKKKLVIAAGLFLLLILAILLYIFVHDTGEKNKTGSDVVAKVGQQPVYQSYIDRELEFFPGKKTPETEKQLKEKVISDEIVLQGAKKEGLISDYPASNVLSAEDYLKRTEDVRKIKEMIENKADGIGGQIVSIWFYNNGYIGPQGLAKGKQIAFEKITNLYNRVKNKEITIQQAGELVASDTSLAEIDPAYEANALTTFRTGKRLSITFWKGFDDLLWKLQPGELTGVYLGTDEKDGKAFEQLYMFGEVDQRIADKGYNSFEEWYDKQVKAIKVGYKFGLFGLDLAYASNGDCGHGCPPWEGFVVTDTGAPIPGVTVTQKNCQPGSKADDCSHPNYSHVEELAQRTSTTDAKGYYSFAAAWPYDCQHNIHVFSASIANGECNDLEMRIGNIHDLQEVGNIVCHVSTPPACGVACTKDGDCTGAKDSCTACVNNTCQVPPPPPSVPACGVACSKDGDCAGAKDSCTACVDGVCKVPPACGVACSKDGDCAGAKDSCTSCVGGVCQIPPACGVACTTKADCAGAKDGCTDCYAGSCSDFSESMCKCDGLDVDDQAFQYPGATSFDFTAFGKVEGGDITKAQIQSMKYRLFKSSKANPNVGTVIADSDDLTASVVETSSSKVRYKTTWSIPPPDHDQDAIYRVQADIKCVPRKASASASNSALAQVKGLSYSPVPNYSPVKLASSNNLAQLPVPSGVNENLQLQTLKYVKVLNTDSCKNIMFEYEDTFF